MGDCCIGEVEEYKYLGITIEGGKHGGLKSMGDRMKEANGLIEIVKYAAERSGSKYVIGREGWKTMIASKLIYGCGTLAWYQHKRGDLEVIQNGFGRWLWEVGKVRNEIVRGESGWSSFAEREVKCIVDWLIRIVYEESLVSDIGRDGRWRLDISLGGGQDAMMFVISLVCVSW